MSELPEWVEKKLESMQKPLACAPSDYVEGWKMTNYTPEQVAAAARLVPELNLILQHGKWLTGVPIPEVHPDAKRFREWQPWADTEAGRSDALGLLAAVQKWMSDDDVLADSTVEHWNLIDDALMSGNVQQIQQATMAAAIAIGEHMGKEEGK